MNFSLLPESLQNVKNSRLICYGQFTIIQSMLLRGAGTDFRLRPLDPQKLPLEADPLSKWGVRLQNSSTYSPKKGVRLQNASTYSPKKGGSASRLHQHTAPQKGVRLQNSSTKGGSASRIHQLKGGPPLDFINIQPQNGGVRLQNSSTSTQKKGSASRDNFYGLSGTYISNLSICRKVYFLECVLILAAQTKFNQSYILRKFSWFYLCFLRSTQFFKLKN